ncbi:MAG: hypothetical protein EOP00_25565 [Pedobacter sp.]|nr:MAG: hypothetical protein EOP00_25565 [Pedobacter sp.]
MDTVSAIVKYWEKHCGLTEPLLRIKILLAINGDSLNDKLYSGIPVINYLINFRESRRYENIGYSYGQYYGAYPPMNTSFDNFTKDLALKLKKNPANSALDNFFLDLYSQNFDKIFYRLQDSVLNDSTLKQSYKKELQRYIHLPEGHFAMYTGMWLPSGNLSIVGNHPLFGFQIGVKKKKTLIDGVMELKFGNSPNVYFVQKDDSLYSTKHFFGGFIGLDLGYELINKKGNEIDLLAGTAWDGFDVLDIGKPDDPDRITKTINALNFNVGIGYRTYFKNKSYLGIETRYNVVNYQNKNGTDLSGNTLTIRLKYGISRNIYKDNALRRLDYKQLIENEKYYKWLESPKAKNRY